MPWIENEQCNQRLFQALQELAAERGALERLVGAINNDEASKALDEARRGEKHQPRKALLATTTLTRWLEGGLSKLSAAQPHKKRLVYEFLERSQEFRTDLFNPAPSIPAGLTAFLATQGDALSRLQFDGLGMLDGRYHLLRRAWTEPDNNKRMVLSKLDVKTEAGLTRFVEFNEFHDSRRQDVFITERDEGIVVRSGGGLFMLAIGQESARLKLYCAHAVHPAIDGTEMVRELKGNVMNANSASDSASQRFIASRVGMYAEDPGTLSTYFANEETLKWLELEKETEMPRHFSPRKPALN